MEENKKYIDLIQEQIKQLKFEIIEKQNKLDEILKIVNNESDEDYEEDI